MTFRSTQPGYFRTRRGAGTSGMYLDFNCPCGCGEKVSLPICLPEDKENHETSWEWNGNVVKPSLVQSVRRLACGWHGFLTMGVWKSCGDGVPNAPDCCWGGL